MALSMGMGIFRGAAWVAFCCMFRLGSNMAVVLVGVAARTLTPHVWWSCAWYMLRGQSSIMTRTRYLDLFEAVLAQQEDSTALSRRHPRTRL